MKPITAPRPKSRNGIEPNPYYLQVEAFAAQAMKRIEHIEKVLDARQEFYARNEEILRVKLNTLTTRIDDAVQMARASNQHVLAIRERFDKLSETAPGRWPWQHGDSAEDARGRLNSWQRETAEMFGINAEVWNELPAVAQEALAACCKHGRWGTPNGG